MELIKAMNPEQPAVKRRVGGTVRRGRALRRQLLFKLWAHLSPGMQKLLMRLGSTKVTYGACAVIRDTQDRVLLVHHSYRRVYPWGLPGGLGKRGEQPATTVAREIREELGLEAKVGRVLHAEIHDKGRHMTLYFQVSIAELPRIDGVEIDAVRYATPAEVGELFGMPNLPWLWPAAELNLAQRRALRLVGK